MRLTFNRRRVLQLGYTLVAMVWTEVSWLLAAVAVLFLLVLLFAILSEQIWGSDLGRLTRIHRRRLPENADISDGDRRMAMRRLADERAANSKS